MRLFGYQPAKNFKISNLQITSEKIPVGGRAVFQFLTHNQTSSRQKIRLEYEIIYARPQGKTASKVFQIEERNLNHERKNFTKESWILHHEPPGNIIRANIF